MCGQGAELLGVPDDTGDVRLPTLKSELEDGQTLTILLAEFIKNTLAKHYQKDALLRVST